MKKIIKSLEHIYLGTWFVIGISKKNDSIQLLVEVPLKPTHPKYQKPQKYEIEFYCFASLIVTGVIKTIGVSNETYELKFDHNRKEYIDYFEFDIIEIDDNNLLLDGCDTIEIQYNGKLEFQIHPDGVF